MEEKIKKAIRLTKLIEQLIVNIINIAGWLMILKFVIEG